MFPKEVKNRLKKRDSRKDKKMKPAVVEEGEIVCDCDCYKKQYIPDDSCLKPDVSSLKSHSQMNNTHV